MNRNFGARIAPLAVCFAVLAFIGVSCSQKEEAPAQAAYKDELRIAYNAQPPTLDVPITSAAAARGIGRGIYESLYALTTDFRAVPELAESVDVNPSSTQFVFHLRKNVLFHNGQEMKAADAAASMNRWIEVFSGAKDLAGDKRFEVVDDYTVKIVFDKPVISFLTIIAGAKQIAAIMPAGVIANAGAAGLKEFIGTGPYKFSEWKQDQYILLEKFDGYKPLDAKSDGYSGKKEALTQKVYFDIVPDASTRFNGLQTGEYDIAVSLTIDNYDTLKTSSEYEPDIELAGGMTLVLNKKAGLCVSKEFRQAVLAALNMETLMQGAVSNVDFMRLDSSYMFEEQVFWHSKNGSDKYNRPNPDTVKNLLAKSGYKGQEFRLIVSPAYQEFYNGGIIFQSQLKEAGINVRLDVMDWPSQQQRMTEPNAYEGFITYFSPVTVPTELLYLSPNWAGWTVDPEIERLLSGVRSAPTLEEAQKIWFELQGYAWESVPAIKFGDMYMFGAHSVRVEGYEPFMGPIIWNTKVKQ
jgi:peptide/nickel transport system substrate-binding protein